MRSPYSRIQDTRTRCKRYSLPIAVKLDFKGKYQRQIGNASELHEGGIKLGEFLVEQFPASLELPQILSFLANSYKKSKKLNMNDINK